MDAKDLRTEAALGDRSNNGNSKYAQGGGAVPCHRNKTYQDIGSNSLGKVDVSAARPCAVIGPDRVVPPPVSAEAYLKKGTAEPWLGADNMYRRPPEYPNKILNYQHPTRNISPRQTFQENMQRIMVAPTYKSMKSKEDLGFPGDSSTTQIRINKLNVSSDPNQKYCDVPYNMNPITNEHNNVRNADASAGNSNPVLTQTAPNNWPTASANLRPAKPYPQEFYQYPEYSSCAGPRPMLIPRPHRSIHEEPSPVYPDGYYHDGNIRFKPYPTPKERYPQSRYEYIANYPNPFQPPPPFQSQKYEMQKPMPPHSYPGYPQIPLKYLDGRIVEPVMNGYQRPINQPNYNMPYQNQVVHPNYGPIPGNCVQTNKFYPYHPDNSKAISSNKLPYDNNGKIYTEFENSRLKGFPVPEGFYINEIGRAHHMKGQVLPPNYPANVHAMSAHPYFRKDNLPIRGYEYGTHFRNVDPSLNMTNPLARLPSQFSPTAIAISPSDSITSNDTNQSHVAAQEDCGYVSQSSTASARSIDSAINRFPPDFYRRYDPKYSPLMRTSNLMSKHDTNQMINVGSKHKKDIDVRQFLQMWNEGEDENGENKDTAAKPMSTNTNNNVNHHENSSQEPLYVLGLVNVPSEELSKYEHIQKVSKLPENIKGYNSIELLHQFEEVIESSNLNQLNSKPSIQRDFHTPLKGAISLHGISIPSRPLSPLDVEAKISQSVIHKEVGCNFEIKPCSPKMLNVEVATPVQSVFTERVIEKVSNPLIIGSSLLQDVNEDRDNCSIIQCQDRISETPKINSCKMINTQYNGNDSANLMKTNYSFQDLESNSGVCLASLPRLDNDIELNFPEVNQQFINANKVESSVTTSPLKDLPTLDVHQSDLTDGKITDVESPLSSNNTEKELSKLSKYRKFKRRRLSSPSLEASVQALRTDSVIIKNPDNVKNHDSVSENSSKIKSEEAQLDPINLTVAIDHLRDSEQKSNLNGTPKDECSHSAIDFSLNSVDHCQMNNEKPFSTNPSTLKNELNEPSDNSLGNKNKTLNLDSVTSPDNAVLEKVKSLEVQEKVGSEIINPLTSDIKFTETLNKTSGSDHQSISNASENTSNDEAQHSNIDEIRKTDDDFSDTSLFYSLSDKENSKERDTNILTQNEESESQRSSSSPHESASEISHHTVMEDITINNLDKNLDNTEKNITKDMTCEIDVKKMEFNDLFIENAIYTETLSLKNNEIQEGSKYSDKHHIETDHINKLRQVDCESETTNNTSYHLKYILLGKELFSPWIQKLCLHTEGFCNSENTKILFNDKIENHNSSADYNSVDLDGNLDSIIQHTKIETSADDTIIEYLQPVTNVDCVEACTDLGNENITFNDKVSTNYVETIATFSDNENPLRPSSDNHHQNLNDNRFQDDEIKVSPIMEKSKEDLDPLFTNKGIELDLPKNTENNPQFPESHDVSSSDSSSSSTTTTTRDNDSLTEESSSSSSDDEDTENDEKNSKVRTILRTHERNATNEAETNDNANTPVLDCNVPKEFEAIEDVVEQKNGENDTVKEKGSYSDDHVLNKSSNLGILTDSFCNNSNDGTDDVIIDRKDYISSGLKSSIKDINICREMNNSPHLTDNLYFNSNICEIDDVCVDLKRSTKETNICNVFDKDDSLNILTYPKNVNDFYENSLDKSAYITNIGKTDILTTQSLGEKLEEESKALDEMVMQTDIDCNNSNTIFDSDCRNESSRNSVFEILALQEDCNVRIVDDNKIDKTQLKSQMILQNPHSKLNKMRILKRSYSDSALDSICENLRKDEEKLTFSKRKKMEADNFLRPSYCNVIQNNRRNSVSSIQNPENVSFCILIEDDCIITENNEESDNICFAAMSEDCLTCVDPINDEEEPVGEIISFQEDTNCFNEYSNTDIFFDETAEEPWVDDVACVETVVADDIAENIVISASTSPQNNLSDGESNDDDTELYNINEHTDKLKYIYGDKMCSDDSHFVDTLYRTPQMNVDKTLNNRESQDDGNRYYDKESLEKVLSESNVNDELSRNSSALEFTSSLRLPSPSISTPRNKENIELHNFNTSTTFGLNDIVHGRSETNNDCTFVLKEYEKIFHEAKSGANKLYEASIDVDFIGKTDESPKYSSSFPEVSSTTSEERNSGIFLKITNYGGSIVSQINEVNTVNRICCKYTEKKDYLSSNASLPSRTLITKAAQKYIPPLRESIPDLKIKLRLPQHSLTKLKQLKMAKETLKGNVNKTNSNIYLKKEIPKKSKPKFEDVLKSIDEIQFQKHKEKSKEKKERKSIPKVVIKKSENGSHYASTSGKDKFNPDLTGRKWQPWVFLEKNIFIDKMAIKRKTRAIFSHRKNTFVLAEKFQKYKSISNAKFIITQPKINESTPGHLKYRITLKQNF